MFRLCYYCWFSGGFLGSFRGFGPGRLVVSLRLVWLCLLQIKWKNFKNFLRQFDGRFYQFRQGVVCRSNFKLMLVVALFGLDLLLLLIYWCCFCCCCCCCCWFEWKTMRNKIVILYCLVKHTTESIGHGSRLS